MRVHLNSIDGIPDAFAALLMSKRNWDIETDKLIRETCRVWLVYKGRLKDRKMVLNSVESE